MNLYSIKERIESNRGSKRKFWKISLFLKDNLWYLLNTKFQKLQRISLLNDLLHNQTKIKQDYSRIIPLPEGMGNDYSFIEKRLKEDTPKKYTKKASIIIPVYNRKKILEKTLASLIHQTYPKKLFEIIITDDGSSDGVEKMISKYKKLFNLKFITQEDKGFRVSKARNEGIRACKNEYLIFLDCDTLPAPTLIEDYMKWFHITDNVFLLGNRKFINTDKISATKIKKDFSIIEKLPITLTKNDVSVQIENGAFDWRYPIFLSTNYLKNSPNPFKYCIGANFAISKSVLEKSGLFNEEFTTWGCEDEEFAFRIYEEGAYFIPVLSAIGYHQEHEVPKTVESRKKQHETSRILYKELVPSVRSLGESMSKRFRIPKVSIYIPVYNSEKYIEKTINSALNQTFKDLEICICDDGSTDKTPEILKKYENNPLIKIKRIKNSGIGKASNTAISMCQGEFIAQLDSDDILHPKAVETLAEFLNHNPEIGVVYSDNVKIDKNGKYLCPGYYHPNFTREKLLKGMIVHHFRMFRKRDFNRTEKFDEKMVNAVDYDFFFKLSKVCELKHLPKRLYLYRVHSSSTSIAKKEEQRENDYKVKQKMFEYYLKNYPSLKEKIIKLLE